MFRELLENLKYRWRLFWLKHAALSGALYTLRVGLGAAALTYLSGKFAPSWCIGIAFGIFCAIPASRMTFYSARSQISRRNCMEPFEEGFCMMRDMFAGLMDLMLCLIMLPLVWIGMMIGSIPYGFGFALMLSLAFATTFIIATPLLFWSYMLLLRLRHCCRLRKA